MCIIQISLYTISADFILITPMYWNSLFHSHINLHAHAHAHTHACTHTHTRMHAHTHIHLGWIVIDCISVHSFLIITGSIIFGIVRDKGYHALIDTHRKWAKYMYILSPVPICALNDPACEYYIGSCGTGIVGLRNKVSIHPTIDVQPIKSLYEHIS